MEVQDIERQSKEVTRFKKRVSEMLQGAESIEINTEADLKPANEYLAGIKQYKDTVMVERQKIVEPAHTTWKNAIALFKKLLDPLDKARSIIDGKISAFMLAEKKKRDEAQRKLEEKARLEEEKKKKKLLERAKIWEDRGATDKAEELREEAKEVFIPSEEVQQVEKTQHGEVGKTTMIEDFDVHIMNKMDVIKQVIESKLPEAIVNIDEGKLKKYMKDFRLKFLPGVITKPKFSTRVQAK
ncbi:MAG: hypothetical protein ACFFDN_13965 [Candidatus Hodarchaeota archaeon]